MLSGHRSAWRRRSNKSRAARIAVGTVAAELAAVPKGIERVVMCCFASEAADHHIAALGDLGLA